MTIAHKLVGYDKRTELVTAEYEVPIRTFDIVRRVAGVAPADDEAIGNYPLDPPAAQEIAKIIGAAIDTKQLDFFLEPEA